MNDDDLRDTLEAKRLAAACEAYVRYLDTLRNERGEQAAREELARFVMVGALRSASNPDWILGGPAQ